jgi:putative membrane protein
MIFLLAFTALFAFACQKNESTTTASSTTSTAATDTSATTSTRGTTAVTSTTPLNAADKDFATKAAEGGMMEVDLGQLAAAKATSSDVKDFGNRMVADHGKANDDLKSLAAAKGLTLPTQSSAEEKKTANDLEKKKGKDFDKAYISDMVKDHQKDAKEFEKATKDVQDPDLKSWASKTLPVVQDHLKMAKEIAAKLK